MLERDRPENVKQQLGILDKRMAAFIKRVEATARRFVSDIPA